MIDYPERLKLVRQRMAERNVGLMYLPPGANLFYLTGIRRQEQGGTDHNAYGDYVVGGYLGLRGGVTLLSPRMGGGYYRGEAQDKPWLEEVRLIDESESPRDVLQQTLRRFDLAGQKVAVDDRVWAQSLLALKQLLPQAEFVLASELLMPLRMLKSEAELDLMRKAGQITEQVFERALERLKPGVSEWDIAAEIDYQFKNLGAAHTSFVTGIFFAGEAHDRNTVAGRASEKRLQRGDSVMFDFGCVYEGYCSDFGRSAFCGEPTAEYLKVHDLILAAQRAGMAAMKAGQVTGAQVNATARKLIEDAGYGQYFTHRLGHGIGITVHEPPWLDVVEQSILRSNMTFTVEPSIIVPDRVGNRVEDVVLVTASGGQSLYA
ncbi:MAG TPA: Xaa-Pro peptidase family protein, partial [Chloroflexota bacterium]|nr:Xaa-Pro peptidase family protein [Chloroflexota bacterium]